MPTRNPRKSKHVMSRRRKDWDRPIMVVGESAAIVPLTRGGFALIDIEDIEMVSHIPWYLDTSLYATSEKCGAMHRFITGLDRTDRRVVDHKNGLRCDNRRSNLKVCTQSENMASAVAARISKLPAGVKRNGKKFSSDGIAGYLGTFDTIKEAVVARIISLEVHRREGRHVRWTRYDRPTQKPPMDDEWCHYLGINPQQMDQLVSSKLRQPA